MRVVNVLIIEFTVEPADNGHCIIKAASLSGPKHSTKTLHAAACLCNVVTSSSVYKGTSCDYDWPTGGCSTRQVSLYIS